MKKIIAIILIALSMSVLSACGFISYEPGMTEEEIAVKAQLDGEIISAIEKINGLSSEENYREEERVIYRRVLREAENELSEAATIEQLNSTYAYYENVISNIKTAAEYEFLAYRESAATELQDYFDYSLYRKEEADSAKQDYDELLAAIEAASDIEAIDSAIRDYKVKVYQYKTDAELYAEETAALISDVVSAMELYYDEASYRESELTLLSAIKNNYTELIRAALTKEKVNELFYAYKLAVDAVKTDVQLYEDERSELINDCYSRLLGAVDAGSMTSDELSAHIALCNNVREKMLAVETKKAILAIYLSEAEKLYTAGAQNGDQNSLTQLKSIFGAKLQNYADLSLYREQQITDINNIAARYSDKICAAADYSEALGTLEEGFSLIDEVFTNEQMWEKEDAEFFTYMNEKYGEYILKAPDKMTEADNYYELAAIIDWYAFYQLDYSSFERSKFRVRLNYAHRHAQWEINEVYWYCELIRTAVGITGHMEDEDHLIIELLPYAISSKTNSDKINKTIKYKSLVEYDSDKSAMTARADDFEDFPYTHLTKIIDNIWNTQQLWYALEHGYKPLCVPGSKADLTLSEAKNILRKLILNGMSDDEKVFTIYSWCVENIFYDTKYAVDLGSSDVDLFPDERASLSDAFHADGAILNHVGVCEGYAKSYLLLLRMEGIESYRIFRRFHTLLNKNSMNAHNGGYGSHAFVAVKLSDGYFYFSDTEAKGHITYHQIAVSPSLFTGQKGFTYIFPEFVYGEAYGPIYDKLVCGKTGITVTDKTQLESFLSELVGSSDIGIQLSLLVDPDVYPDFKDDLIELGANVIDSYEKKYAANKVSKLYEYILYKEKLGS